MWLVMFDFDNDVDATEFEPSPWGSRQRVIPRAEFRVAAAKRTPPPIQSLVSRVAQSAVSTHVREADIPTWRVPKLEFTPSPLPAAPKPRKRRLDLRRWLPIAGIPSIVIIALVGASVARVGDVHADASSISAALLDESSETRIQGVANIEVPPAPQAVESPHHVVATATPKHTSEHTSVVTHVKYASNRPLLAVDFATPLGDLGKKHRR
jgi:hypothetical protein